MSCYYRYNGGSTWRQDQDQAQAQGQGQAQGQAQGQLQDADQDQKNVFKEIGNVHIDMFNDNVLVAVLVVVAVLTGVLDGASVQALLDRFIGGINPAR